MVLSGPDVKIACRFSVTMREAEQPEVLRQNRRKSFGTSPSLHWLSSALFCAGIVAIAVVLVIYLPTSDEGGRDPCLSIVHRLSPLLGMGTLGLCLATHSDRLLALSIPNSDNSTLYVDTSFIGFAFEQASFYEYSTDSNGNTNAFSTNLLETIMSRTNGTPYIRLGGTSADYGKYLPGQREVALPKAEVDNFQAVGNTTIGRAYWKLTENFPSAKYIVQVPLVTTNVSETLAWAKSAVDVIGVGKLHAIELGNEPDLYSAHFKSEYNVSLGPPDWQDKFTNETYVGKWSSYAAAIVAAVDLPTEPYFQAFDVGTHYGDQVTKESYILDTETCFNLGINKDSLIKTVAHHYYQNQAGSAETLATGLMTMSVTHTHLDQYRRRIDWLRDNKPEIPFILSEVGNSLKMTHNYEYQARLGSALWQVDFYLYAMNIGVARINYQQIMHAGYNLWLPVESQGMPAQVFSNFYAQPLVADFIGATSKTTVRKQEFGNADAGTNVAAYVAYEEGTPQRVAIVNLHYWNATSSGMDRPNVQVAMAVPNTTSEVEVWHLSSPQGAGAGAESMTYAGSQWTYESVGKEMKGVRNDTETIGVVEGVATIIVNSSEAILVWL